MEAAAYGILGMSQREARLAGKDKGLGGKRRGPGTA